jgi:hypothetical protein
VAVDHHCIYTDATVVVTNEWVPLLTKEDNEDCLLEVTATVVPDEIKPISKSQFHKIS